MQQVWWNWCKLSVELAKTEFAKHFRIMNISEQPVEKSNEMTWRI